MGPDPAVAAVRRAVRVALGEPAGSSGRRTPSAGLDAPADAPVDSSVDVSAGDHDPTTRAEPRAARDRPLLVALSGGPDSLALAAATAFVADRHALVAGAVVVDHGLQDGSAAVAAHAATLAYELGLDPVHVVRVDVATGPAAGGREAAARAARYRAIEDVAVPTDAVVLLGHTRDDQAETVLLGLGRGSGPRSIAGMRRRDGRYLRPFLDVDRATTERACAALGLPVWHDPHNADRSFRRVRVRHEVLPLLEDVLGGGVAAALARTADLLRVDLDALDQLAGAHDADGAGGRDADGAGGRDADGAGGRSAGWHSVAQVAGRSGPNGALDLAGLAGEPEALRTRLLRGWASGLGAGPLTAAHVTALAALAGPGREGRAAHLPGGFVAVRRSGRLHMQCIEVHNSGPRRPG